MRLAHTPCLALVVVAAGLFSSLSARAQAPMWQDLSDLNGPACSRPSGATPDRATGANPILPPSTFPDSILGVCLPLTLDRVGLTDTWGQSANLWMTGHWITGLDDERPLYSLYGATAFGSEPLGL